jgi:hypothetical protein
MIDSTRFPAERLRSASIFKPATCGKRPLGAGRHQVDVIDQNERDACGRVRRRAGKADAADWNKQKAGGKTAANEEHSGMLLGPDLNLANPAAPF